MFKHLRRWHFDVAIFIGLALFATAFLISKPTPAWQSYYSSTPKSSDLRLSILGYSADDQIIYTHSEDCPWGGEWSVPRIQQWNANTGQLLKEYPVQMPDEDRALLKLPKARYDSTYSIDDCRDPQFFMIRHYQTQQQKQHRLRLYRRDGTTVGKAIDLNPPQHASYLPDQLTGRHYALLYELMNFNRPTAPVSLIDIDTGKTLCTYKSLPEERLYNFLTFPGGQFLGLLWRTKTNLETLEVVETITGISHGRFTLPHGKQHDIVPLDETHWAICSMIKDGDSFYTRLEFYLFDPQARTLVPDPSHPLHGFTSSKGEWLLMKTPYVLSLAIVNENQNEPEVFKTVRGWLSRIGIHRPSNNTECYKVTDLATGKQIRHFSYDANGALARSSDLRTVVYYTHDPQYEPGLALYLIPDHRWVSTLSLLQWLSWLLVIPWPIRYLIGTRK